MNLTGIDVARRFIGIHELPGKPADALIVAMLQCCDKSSTSDEIAWCSAFVNFVAMLFPDTPRSKSLAARSWLLIGRPVALRDAVPGWDVVVLKRGDGQQPGPDVIQAQGHVGFFVSTANGNVLILGGNQGDAVSLAQFPVDRVLGVRRIRED